MPFIQHNTFLFLFVLMHFVSLHLFKLQWSFPLLEYVTNNLLLSYDLQSTHVWNFLWLHTMLPHILWLSSCAHMRVILGQIPRSGCFPLTRYCQLFFKDVCLNTLTPAGYEAPISLHSCCHQATLILNFVVNWMEMKWYLIGVSLVSWLFMKLTIFPYGYWPSGLLLLWNVFS